MCYLFSGVTNYPAVNYLRFLINIQYGKNVYNNFTNLITNKQNLYSGNLFLSYQYFIVRESYELDLFKPVKVFKSLTAHKTYISDFAKPVYIVPIPLLKKSYNKLAYYIIELLIRTHPSTLTNFGLFYNFLFLSYESRLFIFVNEFFLKTYGI